MLPNHAASSRSNSAVGDEVVGERPVLGPELLVRRLGSSRVAVEVGRLLVVLVCPLPGVNELSPATIALFSAARPSRCTAVRCSRDDRLAIEQTVQVLGLDESPHIRRWLPSTQMSPGTVVAASGCPARRRDRSNPSLPAGAMMAAEVLGAEAEQREIEVHALEVGQLQRQEFHVPRRQRGDLVVGDAQRLDLFGVRSSARMVGTSFSPSLPRRAESRVPAMITPSASIRIGTFEAERLDALGHRVDGGVVDGAGLRSYSLTASMGSVSMFIAISVGANCGGNASKASWWPAAHAVGPGIGGSLDGWIARATGPSVGGFKRPDSPRYGPRPLATGPPRWTPVASLARAYTNSARGRPRTDGRNKLCRQAAVPAAKLRRSAREVPNAIRLPAVRLPGCWAGGRRAWHATCMERGGGGRGGEG